MLKPFFIRLNLCPSGKTVDVNPFSIIMQTEVEEETEGKTRIVLRGKIFYGDGNATASPALVVKESMEEIRGLIDFAYGRANEWGDEMKKILTEMVRDKLAEDARAN